MPTYEFRCPNGHDFERFYKTISAGEAEVPCPECGAVATRRLSGGAGLLFKGSGFYLTDYGKNAHRKSGADTPKTDTKPETSSAKPESKPDTSTAKSESKPAAKPSKPKSE